MSKTERKKRKSLREQLEQLREELDLLHAITNTIWSEIDLETVLRRIVELVRRHTGADSCLLYLFEKEKGELVLSASSSSVEFNDRVVLKLGEGITGWVAANRKTVAISEKSYSDSRFKLIPNLVEDTYESFLSVPMLFKGKLIGVLNVLYREPHSHSEREIKLVESVAQQVSGVIANARLYRQLKEKAEKLEAFYEISKLLASGYFLDDFLLLILSAVSELINSRFCSLFLFNSEKGKFFVASIQPYSKEIHENLSKCMDSKVLQEVYFSKKPSQHLHLPSEEDRLLECLSEAGLRSGLFVPLVDRGNCLGVLGVYTAYPHAFGAEEVRLVQSLANHAAIALRSSQIETHAKALERKLNERKAVEKAKGILMEKYGLTEENAYHFLRKKSMDLRKSLGEVAESIITFSEIGGIE